MDDTSAQMPIRDPLADAMFAAWVNVPPDKVPPEMKHFTCQATMAAWGRVADAARHHLNHAPADPVRDALAEALEEVTNGENWRSGRKFDPNSGNFDLSKQRAALALAKGEKP